MPFWLIELLFGSMLLWWGRALFLRALHYIAPRRWRGPDMPAFPDSERHAFTLLGNMMAGLLIVFSPLLFFPSWPGWKQILWGTGLGIVVFPLAWSGAFVKHWWLLESGSPLRASLDSLAHQTGRSAGRVRLRVGKAVIPRTCWNGSIELSTAFLQDTPADEQRFLIAAALYDRQAREQIRRALPFCICLILYPFAFWGGITLGHVGRIPLAPLSAILIFYGIWRILTKPQYSDATLKFALEATGDWEAAERAIRRVDSQEVDKRLRALRSWWQEQQAQSAAAHSITQLPTSNPVQQQGLGRKP